MRRANPEAAGLKIARLIGGRIGRNGQLYSAKVIVTTIPQSTAKQTEALDARAEQNETMTNAPPTYEEFVSKLERAGVAYTLWRCDTTT